MNVLKNYKMISFRGKKVFISGGNGVIGNELVDRLYEQGAIIFVGDLKPRPKHWPNDIIYRQGDLNYITKEELDNFGPEYFFHLAATFERSIETYEFWEENFWHNVRLSNYLMSLLKNSPTLKKVIFASSYLIYNSELYTFDKPTIEPHRLKENDPVYPRNLTGSAKLNHEIELRFLDNFKNKQWGILLVRIFRSYGKNSRDIISRWIRDLIKNETLTVYRKEGRFDFIYAGEVAEGLLRLSLIPEARGVFNLGNDNARSIADVLTELRKYFPEMRYKESESDIAFEASQANMDYFYKIAGWKPERQLEDVIPEIIKFEKERAGAESLEKKFNILLTSISKKVPMIKAVRRASQKIANDIKLYGGDVDNSCLGHYFVDGFWNMPRSESLAIEEVIEYCQKNNIKAVIPSRDGELLYWAQNKERLGKEGISVMTGNYKGVNTCLDKAQFSDFLLKHDLPAIPTATDINEIKGEKYVVKEKLGAGAINLGLNLTKEEAKYHSKKMSDPVYQPFIEGEEYSVDAYITKTGKIKGIIARKRDLIIKGESQITTLIDDKEIESICGRVIEALSLYGHVVLQLLKDKSGKCHVIECNTRFGGASTLSVSAGLDSFYWFLLEAGGADIDAYPFIKTKGFLRQIRYPEDLMISKNNT